MRSLAVVAAVLLLLIAVPTASADPPRSAALRDADRAVATAELAGRRLLGLLADTRLARDRRSEACVDGKLSQVNSFGRMLGDRRARLAAAETGGDLRGAAHERAVIRTILAQLVRTEREGRACVLGEAVRGTVVVVTVDPGAAPREELSLLTEAERRRPLLRR